MELGVERIETRRTCIANDLGECPVVIDEVLGNLQTGTSMFTVGRRSSIRYQVRQNPWFHLRHSRRS